MNPTDESRAREIVKEYTKDWLQPNLISLNGMVPLIVKLIASIRKETVESIGSIVSNQISKEAWQMIHQIVTAKLEVGDGD